MAPSKRYSTKEDKARLRYEATQRREAGEGIADIAAAIGVSPSTLGKWFREWGVVSGPLRNWPRASNLWQRWTREHAKVAITRTDLTIGERAALLGRSYSAVEEFIRTYMRRPSDPFEIK